MTTPTLASITDAITNYVNYEIQPFKDSNAALQQSLETSEADKANLNQVIASLNAQIDILKAGQHPLPSGWTKVTFFDDFSSSSIDTTKWNIRNGAYARNEYSVDEAANVLTGDNVSVAGVSVLDIIAKKENVKAGSTTRSYTSGYLDTIDKHSQEFGRWEMRAKLPTAKGMWPAFWLRGNKGLGEIDIVEAVGGMPNTVQTVHQSTNGDMAKKGHEDSSTSNLGDWHTYAVERELGVVRWYIDDRLVFTVTNKDATWLDSTFNEPMNIRLNLQVGGSMPVWYKQDVDSTTVFPANFVIDYVRVLSR